jgi:hypothetical protein
VVPESKNRADALPLTLIFPMAGRGERFGTTFKPFLQFAGQAFIEAAVEPFRQWSPSISRILFVFLRQQDADFSVTPRLREMFNGLPWEAVTLEKPTAVPAETMTEGVEQAHVRGPAIICDCDHAVNVDPMFARLRQEPGIDCLLPVWKLEDEEIKSWSVASLTDDGSVAAIAEKAVPPGARRAAGVIGCYYFRDVDAVAASCRRQRYVVLSEAIAELIQQGATVKAVPIEEAKFFGDPARLAKAVERHGASD